MSEWAGILVGLGAQAVTALGLVLQKKADNRNEAKPIAERKVYYKNPKWWLGFATFAAGNILTIVALTFATQSVVSGLTATVLVWNALFSPLLLGEHLKWQHILGILVIIGGVVLVVFYGPAANKVYNADELLSLFAAPTFYTYAIVSGIVLLFCWLWVRFAEKKWPVDWNDGTKNKGRFSALCSGSIPAILSSYNILFSKMIGELVMETIDGDSQVGNWASWLFLVLLVACNVVQVHRLQQALSKFSSLMIVPVYQVGVLMFSAVAGGLYFQEFAAYTDTLSPLLFSVGLLIAVVGVAVVTYHHESLEEKLHRAAIRLRFLIRAQKAGEQHATREKKRGGKEEKEEEEEPGRAGGGEEEGEGDGERRSLQNNEREEESRTIGIALGLVFARVVAKEMGRVVKETVKSCTGEPEPSRNYGTIEAP